MIRPDLSAPRGLSKSELGTWEWCQTEAFYKIHEPRPFIPNEATVFGSAVDRGAEVYIIAARAGLTADDVDADARAMDAAQTVIDESKVEVDPTLVRHALVSFSRDIIPSFDWTNCRTQVAVSLPIDGLGDCDGHPDIVMGDDRVMDIKTGSAKTTARTLELGFYALLIEAETGRPVPSVSYIYWNRKLVKPRWAVVTEPVTDELRRWAYESAAAYVRAKEADAQLQRWRESKWPGSAPQNYTFSGGPAWPGKCAGCAYAPVNGGSCVRAWNEEGTAA